MVYDMQLEDNPLVHLQVMGYENGQWNVFAVYEDGYMMDWWLTNLI